MELVRGIRITDYNASNGVKNLFLTFCLVIVENTVLTPLIGDPFSAHPAFEGEILQPEFQTIAYEEPRRVAIERKGPTDHPGFVPIPPRAFDLSPRHDLVSIPVALPPTDLIGVGNHAGRGGKKLRPRQLRRLVLLIERKGFDHH